MSDVTTDPGAGSMAPGASESAGASAPPAGGGADRPTPGATTAPASDAFADLPEPPAGVNTFDRAYVEKVRAEAARHRTAAQEASERLKGYEVFDAYEPDDRAVWVNLASAWQRDPAEAARVMAQIASGVLGDDGDGDGDGGLDDGDDSMPEGPLTREQVAELIETREAQRAEQARLDAEVDTVVRTVADAGYPQGTAEHAAILWRAAHQHNGDLGAAIAAHRAAEQGVIDRYVAGKTGAVTSPNGGAAATGHRDITTLRQATQAAEEYMRNRRNVGG